MGTVSAPEPKTGGTPECVGCEGALESVSKRKINEPKDDQDNHIRDSRVGCRTERHAVSTCTVRQEPVSHQHGPARSVLNGSRRRDWTSSKRGSAICC